MLQVYHMLHELMNYIVLNIIMFHFFLRVYTF